VRVYAADLYQIGDTVGDDPGLTAAGAGDDKQRPVNGFYGLFLGRIKSS